MIFSTSSVLTTSPQLQNSTHHPKTSIVCICSQFLFSPSAPRQTLFHFLSLQISILWTFHINEIIQDMVFCAGLFSLSIMFLRFIHVAAGIKISFLLWLNTTPFYIYVSYFIILSSMDRYLGYFQLLAIVNNATVNIDIEI